MDSDVARYRNRYSREEVQRLIISAINSLEDNQIEGIANNLSGGDFSCEEGVFVEHPFGSNIESRKFFREIEKGDSVIVLPNMGNDYKEQFQATVVGHKPNPTSRPLPSENFVVVVDQDDVAWDVEASYIMRNSE